MKNEIVVYSNYEIDQSKRFIYSLFENTEFKKREKYCDIIDESFGKEIDLKKTLRGNFYNCFFNKSEFDDFDCSDYYFSSCDFRGCKAHNSNFTYLGIDFSKLYDILLLNTSFEYSILEKTNIDNLFVRACNFQNTIIKNCSFANAKIECSDFAGSVITNTSLENINLLNSDIQYVEFNNTVCKNVSFYMEDILHSFNGIQMINKNKQTVTLKSLDSSREISGEKFINSLKYIMPYFFSIQDYFSLANISLFYGDTNKAFEYILLGLKFNLEQRDFKAVRYLCKLAASTPLFNYNDLKSLYRTLQSNSISSQLTRFEYRRYINEMNEIKHLLIENPSSQIQMNITINTLIDEYDYEKLMCFIETIDSIANVIIPQTKKSISIRHNSSPIIDIFLSGEWTSLIPFFALLCSVLGCSIKYIKQIYELLITHETLVEKKWKNRLNSLEYEEHILNIELEKQEIEKKQLEKNTLIANLKKAEENYDTNLYSHNIHGDETQGVFYSIKTDIANVPIEARQMSFTFDIKK